jgi:signal transduction histidine kinase/PAS domain-containing protein
MDHEHLLLDHMTEGLIVASLSGDVRFWNRAALLAHGFADAEDARRAGPAWSRLCSMALPDGTPLDAAEWPLQRVLRGEQVSNLLLRLKRGAEDRPYCFHGGTLSAGGEQLVYVTMSDRAAEVQATKILGISDSHLRNAVEAANIGTWEIDFDAQLVTHSAELSQLLGVQGTRTYPLGASPGGYNAEDRATERAAFARACDPAGDGLMRFESRAARPDGTTVWMRTSGRVTFGPGPDGPRPVLMVGASVDVTEIRQAERRLATQNAVSMVLAEASTLSEATPRLLQAVCESEGWAFGGIWEVDQKARVLRCAEMWHGPDAPLQAIASQTRTLSFAPGQGLPGRVWASGRPTVIADVATDSGYQRAGVVVAAGLRSALAFPITVRGEVIAVLDFIGASIPAVDPKLLELFAAIGGQLGLFFERKRSEVERRTLETQLRHAQRIEAVGQLSGGIAHDFNNILAAIVGNVQLALMDVPPDHPVVESLEQISQASARAKTLVQQILTFARQRPQQRQVLAIGPVVDESVRLLRALMPASVQLVCTVSKATPDILADATQVEQVIVNLGTNAWHALDGKPGRVTIELQPASIDESQARLLTGLKPGRWARLSVSDNGRGMEPEVLERIFEPFFTTKHAGKGTGLGLSVVHGIAQTHGGVVRVSSTPNAGTTFDIYFPDAGSDARTQEPQAPAVQRGGGQHVLFVDDEAPLVALHKRLLQHLGYRVTAFTAPSTALAAFLAEPWSFAAVFTDMNMPEISGLQLAAEVLKVRPDLRVILASGFITDDLQAEAIRLGVFEVLHKPVSVAQLGDTLAHAFAPLITR